MNVELTDPLTEEEMCSCEALKEHLIELELLTADSNAIVYENEWHSQINLVLEQMNTELNGMDVSQNDIMKKYVCFSYFRFTQSLTLILLTYIGMIFKISTMSGRSRKILYLLSVVCLKIRVSLTWLNLTRVCVTNALVCSTIFNSFMYITYVV